MHCNIDHWPDLEIGNQDTSAEINMAPVGGVGTGSRAVFQGYALIPTVVFVPASASGRMHLELSRESSVPWYMEREWELVGLSFLD